MNIVARYAALAVFIATLGLLIVAHFHDRAARRIFQEGRLETIARAVAFVAAQEDVREDDAAEGSAQRFVVGARQKTEAVNEISLLKRTKYLAHSDEDRVGKRLDKDSLSDKLLYDESRKLIADVKKNIEERESNPELTGNAFKENRIIHEGSTFSVMVPVKRDGEARSVVRVTGQAAPVTTPWPVWVIVVGVLGFALTTLLMTVLRGPVSLVVGTVAMAGTIAAQSSMYVAWSDAVDDVYRARMAKTYGALSASGLLEAQTEDASAVSALQENAKGDRDLRLSTIAPADTESASTRLVHTYDGYRTTYDGSAIAASNDRTTLTLWIIAFTLLGCGILLLGALGRIDRDVKILWGHREAYAYMASAMIGMLVLVFVPVVYGISLGFQKRTYNEFNFVGLANYFEILTDFNIGEPTNFYFTLVVTIMWTFINVALAVSIGLFLALLLNDQFLKARGAFRVILILPWAVPNYITALIWKGMFHKQFGAINQMLEGMGLEGVAWFQSFWPAFSANVATNTWLGFPFMMVVSLGALQSIPTDLYEAAIVDGASRWQRFRNITMPLLMPALVPAVIVGTVWTFNMFNIIYLVSGGAPNGATDILITDAFRWAFERDRYGYAAAYSTVIFLILAIFTTITNRVTGATKGAFE